jgi:hypothetical protein
MYKALTLFIGLFIILHLNIVQYENTMQPQYNDNS